MDQIKGFTLTCGLLVMALFCPHFLFGQAPPDKTEEKQTFLAGLDLGKTIFANLDKNAAIGYTAEGLIKLEHRPGLNLMLSLGYSRFSKAEPYPNTSYTSEGLFGKLGIEQNLNSLLNNELSSRLGLCVVLSRFTSKGDFFIEGDYFTTYKQGYSFPYFAAAVQPYFSETLIWLPPFRLDVLAHASWIFTPVRKNGLEDIHYYMPGVGIHRDSRFSAGISFQLFYAF
jgi:hypothetical protein